MPYVGVILAGVQLFFLTTQQFCGEPRLRFWALANAAGNLNLVARSRWQRTESGVLQYPEMVIHPPNLLFRLYGNLRFVCVRIGSAAGAVSGEKVDSPYA